MILDANVEAVRQKLLDRSAAGIEEYGVSTERDDLDHYVWLLELQQELMDACVYIEAAMSKMRTKGTSL